MAWYRRLDREVKMSRTRQESERELRESNKDSDSWIGSPEAAKHLGWSTRQVQRRATDLDGRYFGGRYLFRESTVMEYAEELRHGNSRGCA
jgi:hypothetical protein